MSNSPAIGTSVVMPGQVYDEANAASTKANSAYSANVAVSMCLLNPANGTYYILGYSPRSGNVIFANAWTDTGTCTANLRIRGALVANISSLAVSNTPISNNATGNNLINIGDSISVNVTSVSSGPAPTQLSMTIFITPS